MKIESTQNAAIKALAKLQTKKGRDQAKKFLVEGVHMIEEAASASLLETIYQLDTLPPLSYGPVIYCSQPVLNKLSAQKSDARYIGVCHFPEPEQRLKGKKWLLLDHLQDPGNLGTLIRSAYSFGLDGILCSPDCADPYSPKTLQSSQGALFHIPVNRMDLHQAVEILHSQNIPVLGAALHQDSIQLHDLSIPAEFAIMIGNEGQGISPSLLDLCDQTVFIEMAQFESLNAAVAGSILMYAFQFPA